MGGSMCKKLVINEKKLKELFVLGTGKNATVYLYKDSAIKVYKWFNRKEDNIQRLIEYSEEKKEILDNCGVIRPLEAVYVESEEGTILSGYSTSIVSGWDLDEIKKSNGLIILDNFDVLEKDLRERVIYLGNKNIKMEDVHSKNIMYDAINDRLVLIDIDTWIFDEPFNHTMANAKELNFAVHQYCHK